MLPIVRIVVVLGLVVAASSMAKANDQLRRFVFVLSDTATDDYVRKRAGDWVQKLQLKRHSIIGFDAERTRAIVIEWKETSDPSSQVKQRFDFSHGRSLFAVAVVFSMTSAADERHRLLQFDNRVYFGDKSGSLPEKYLDFVQRIDVPNYDSNRDAIASILLYTHAIDVATTTSTPMATVCGLFEKARQYTRSLAEPTKTDLVSLSTAIQSELLNRNCGPR
jgi:hypothetical protein